MFKIQSTESQARTGILKTAHGKVETPFFLPVATKTAVKYLDPRDLEEIGIQAIISNAFILSLRHKAITAARDYFNKNDFLEITTPLLVKSTPEGARDYIVPSRVNPGQFYALPQSPQLYKQILMISGFDRYYQTAICLRDEDLRADRQPEHMQWDLEMSFVTSDDIREFVEGLYNHIFKEVLNVKLPKFPVFTYKESMEKYGTDKPDIRFGLELIDVTDVVKKSDFEVFKKSECIKCLNPEKEFGRKSLDKYIDFCTKNGAKGMAWMKVTDKGLEGSIVKFFKPDVQKKLIEKTKAKKGSVLMFIADEHKNVANILGLLRLKIRDDLDLVKADDFKLCWVKDFPLFAWNEDQDRWTLCSFVLRKCNNFSDIICSSH